MFSEIELELLEVVDALIDPETCELESGYSVERLLKGEISTEAG